MTVNEAMVLVKVVKERLNDLKRIREQVVVKSTSRRSYNGETVEDNVQPQYEVRAVDNKITELQNFLFLTDASIKQANAMTQINVVVDVEKLLAPLA